MASSSRSISRRAALLFSRPSVSKTRSQSQRWQSTQQIGTGSKPLWTSGRVALVTSFVASLAYVFGSNESRISTKQAPTADKSAVTPETTHPVATSKHAYATKVTLETAVEELRQALGEDAISTDDEVLRNHGYSEWSSINIDTLPVAVAYPKSTAEVQTIARCCHKNRIPMIPYSGGSSLEANFSAPFGGVSIDFAHMDKVLVMREDDMDVTVQPAVGWMTLNEKIKDSGLFFPVDPGPSAMIGGMVGTGCSGTNAFRYGPMKDWVVNLTVVLADGSVIRTRRRPRKTAAGYNLTGLFIGSEGTLGITTEITLKLAPIPQHTSVAVVNFPELRNAAATAAGVIRSGVPVAAMELMDDVQMSVINRAGGTGRTWAETSTLFFKFSGTPNAVHEHIEQVRHIASKNGGGDFEFTADPEDQKKLWSARKESLWSMLALRKGDEEVWSTDVAVPLSKLADLVAITKKDLSDLNLFASALGHVGDGNFHTSILYDAKNPAERKKVEACVERMVDRALELEGTCTGEHGIGIGKKQSLIKELGPDTVGVMKTIKASLDPLGIMNPGKVFDL